MKYYNMQIVTQNAGEDVEAVGMVLAAGNPDGSPGTGTPNIDQQSPNMFQSNNDDSVVVGQPEKR